MKKIGFLIVGTNFISDRFVDATRGLSGVEVCAVYSRTGEKGNAFAKKHSIPEYYTDYALALTDPAVNAVYIANPNFAHKQSALQAIRQGKHVLCEKIITENLDDFLFLRDEACRYGVVLLEAMRPDFDPAFAVLKESIPLVGTLRRVHFEYCQYSSRYDAFLGGVVENAFNPEIGNSSLADIGIYPLHMLIALFGEPDAVRPLFLTLSNGFMGAGHLAFDYTSQGFIASVDYSKISDGIRPSLIEGELGSVLIDKINGTSKITFTPRRGEEVVLYDNTIKNNMTYEIVAFRDMTVGKYSAEPYLEKTEQTMRVYDLARLNFS